MRAEQSGELIVAYNVSSLPPEVSVAVEVFGTCVLNRALVSWEAFAYVEVRVCRSVALFLPDVGLSCVCSLLADVQQLEC